MARVRGTGKARAKPTGRDVRRFARMPVPIVALDVPTSADAVRLVEELGPACTFYKVGSELFAAAGPAIVDYLRARGADVFLDLKLYDIPNTVERAATVAAGSGVRLLTVHASGGREMLRAAVRGADAGAARAGTACGVLAVTVLTSLDAEQLRSGWGRRIASIEKEVLRLSELALETRAAGVVCSGLELRRMRERFGERLELLVPGVRPGGTLRGDQTRVITPGAAAAAGADYVVLGRAVTRANDPLTALRDVVLDMRGASGLPGG